MRLENENFVESFAVGWCWGYVVRAYPHVGTVYRITGRGRGIPSKEGPRPLSPPNRRIRYPLFLFLLFPVLGVTPLRPTFTLIQSAKKKGEEERGGKKGGGGGGNQIGNLSPRRRRRGKKEKVVSRWFFLLLSPSSFFSPMCAMRQKKRVWMSRRERKKIFSLNPAFFGCRCGRKCDTGSTGFSRAKNTTKSRNLNVIFLWKSL